jgi:hypothetical protein
MPECLTIVLGIGVGMAWGSNHELCYMLSYLLVVLRAPRKEANPEAQCEVVSDLQDFRVSVICTGVRDVNDKNQQLSVK